MSANQQHSTFKTTAIAISAILMLSTFGASPALAKAYKRVHLQVNNQTGHPIKIIDLDYWDSESEKWRSEPVANEVIENNRSWQENRNLERVNGQRVKVRVEYKTRKWNRLLKRWGWKSGKKRFTSKTKTCKRKSEFVMNVR